MAFDPDTRRIALATSVDNWSSQVPQPYSQAEVGGILISAALPLVVKRNSYDWFNNVKCQVQDSFCHVRSRTSKRLSSDLNDSVLLRFLEIAKGLQGGGRGKNEEIFPLGNWGKQKYFCAVETSQERRVGQQQQHLWKGNFHIWENMVIINYLGKPRKWTMLEKFDIQSLSHCQPIGPEKLDCFKKRFLFGYFTIGPSFSRSNKYPALAWGISFP